MGAGKSCQEQCDDCKGGRQPGPSHEVSMGNDPHRPAASPGPKGCTTAQQVAQQVAQPVAQQTSHQQQQQINLCSTYSYQSRPPLANKMVATPQQPTWGPEREPSEHCVNFEAPVLREDVILGRLCANSASKVQDGTEDGSHHLEETIQDQECPPVLTNEPEEGEEEVKINLAREKFKCLAAALFVLACLVAIFYPLFTLKAQFHAPDCKARNSNGTKVYDTESLRSCHPCGIGTYFLPLFGEWEKTWPQPVRIVLYFLGTIWAFLGISLVCGQFMAAIEEITSAERVVWVEVRKGYKHKFHVKCWNSTVANLTLMALGSSAPEILLSIIELVGADFYAGKLGPSTIVGSAAFNLLVITAVCVSAIPAPDTRKIVGTDVYLVTATLSLFAYFWLIIILKWVTPDKVDIEEAILTFLFFPFLIIAAFMADKGWFQVTKKHDKPRILKVQRSDRWIENETNRLQHKFGKELPTTALRLMLRNEAEATRPPARSRAHHRRLLMTALTSGKRKEIKQTNSVVYFGFEKPEHTVLECAGNLKVKLVASQPPGVTIELDYFTKEASAKNGMRYTDVKGTIRFGPNQTERHIDIPIIDDDAWEPDEFFFIHLTGLQVISGRYMSTAPGLDPNLQHQIGIGLTRVTVLNDDMPGTLDFDFPEVFSTEGTDVTVGVHRSHGTVGNITCKYITREDTAVKDVDFTPVEGTLSFENGEKHKTITIPILPQSSKRFSDDRFKVELLEPSPGVLFDEKTDGGAHSAICEVVIIKTAQSNTSTSFNCMKSHKIRNSFKEWGENFEAVWYCNGSASDQAAAGPTDWIMHCLCLVFKVIFSIVPPASLLGGWPSFVLALACIGGVTAFVGDIASLLGCSIGLSDDITAITLVALGTSLPDTLASKTAAEEDETADNSIGNVTGSNCVNVFLGLGLPWSLAAIIWKIRGPTLEWQKKRCHGCSGKSTFKDFLGTYKQGGFIVPSSSLAFSVSVFAGCAVFCLFMLFMRRRMYGGELGGPQKSQNRDSIIIASLWVVYITASVVQSVSSPS